MAKGLTDAEMAALEKQEKGLTDEEMAALESKQSESTMSRKAEAALEAFGGQIPGVPELQAAVSLLLPRPSADAKLKAQGFKVQTQPETYASARQGMLARSKELAKAEPGATAAGTAAGIGAGIGMIPGGILGKGGSFLARAGKSALGGAALGAAQAPGDIEEGEVLQLRKRLEQAGLGAAIGGATPAVGAVFKKVVAPLVRMGIAEAAAVAEKNIKTYAKKTKQIDEIIKRSGGDITDEADRLRESLSKGIQQSKQKLGRQIGDALETYPTDKVVDSSKITQTLDRWKSRLDPDYQGEQIAEIQNMIEKIQKKGDFLSVQDLNKTVDFLQESAKPSYLKGGQIFARGNEAAKASKSAAAEARRILNELAPEVKQANSKLAQMHQIESRMNRNILKAGSPEGALLAAGSGANQRNARMLQALEAVSGVPVASRAAELSAVKAFGNAPIFSLPQTGRALLGFSLGQGLGGQEGAAIGAALSSPQVLRRLIQAQGRIAAPAYKIAKAVGNLPVESILSPRSIPKLVGEGIAQDMGKASIDPMRAQYILNRLKALGE